MRDAISRMEDRRFKILGGGGSKAAGYRRGENLGAV